MTKARVIIELDIEIWSAYNKNAPLMIEEFDDILQSVLPIIYTDSIDFPAMMESEIMIEKYLIKYKKAISISEPDKIRKTKRDLLY